MARGYHRLSFRARHLARQLGKAKNITLQRLHLHELRHAISRKHGFRGPKGKPKLGQPGMYQRLSRKARQLLSRLRRSRSWQVQKQTVNELEREVERGERIAVARAARRQRRAEQAQRAAREAKERGSQFRKWAQRKQEPALVRAERRQAEREAGTRKPPAGTRMRRKGSETARRLRSRARLSRRHPAPQARPQRAPQPARIRPAVASRPLRPVRAPRARRHRLARTR